MKDKIKRERLFLIAFDIFLIGILLNSTKYNIIGPVIKCVHAIQIAGTLIAMFKILLDVKDIFKSKKKIKINYFYLLFFISSLIIFYITKSKSLVYFVVFILAAKDVDFNHILKSQFRTQLIIFAFVLFSCFVGIIPDLTVDRGVLIRHSWGWNSPNCLMLNIFELSTIYLYLKRKNLKLYHFIIIGLILLFGYYITNSRMGLLAGILLLMIFFLLKHTNIKVLYEKLKYLIYAIPTLLLVGFLLLLFAYKQYDLYELDHKLTGRLFFSSNAIEEYGIKPFGTYIKFVGQQLEEEYTEGRSYNYVDNSYLKSLLNSGIIFTFYLIVFLVLLNKHAYKKKDYFLLSIFIISELYCFFDSWLIGIEFNPFLLLLSTYIYPIKLIEEKLEIKSKDKKLLTISVASYNLGDMIKQCLNSIVNSEVAEYIEVIVTDDGSKDNTPDIVKEYVKKYPNIVKLITQKNQGPGSTVNSGIKHANGKYFRMVDGDDRVVTSNLKELITYLDNTNVDMIINNYDYLDHKTEKVIDTVSLDIKEYEEYDFEYIADEIYLEMHNVIYKTSILQNNKIKLDNGFYTDSEYLLFPMPYVKTCVYLPISIYVYRINQSNQSVSFKSMQKNIDGHDLVLNSLINFYKQNKKKLKDNKEYHVLRRISNFADNQLVTLLSFDIDDKQIEKIKKHNEKISKYEDLFYLYSKSKKYRLLNISNYKLTKLLHKLIIKKASK